VGSGVAGAAARHRRPDASAKRGAADRDVAPARPARRSSSRRRVPAFVRPPIGILLNALLYLPFIIWLIAAPYGPKFRAAGATVARRAIRGFGDIWQTLREVGSNRVIVSMTALAGSASLFIGNAYQAQMPGFAQDLGHTHADSVVQRAACRRRGRRAGRRRAAGEP
jgi:hypothetical protein